MRDAAKVPLFRVVQMREAPAALVPKEVEEGTLLLRGELGVEVRGVEALKVKGDVAEELG